MEVDDSQTSNGHESVDRPLESELPPRHTFKILIASDIHLGVHEKDPERGEDSFKTFEEILKTAKEKDVDFILLGGDLFDQSKPSQSCYVKAITLIREHIMGDKPISMALHEEVHPAEVFETSVIGSVNYEDPNVNISYPIFSIHGNHDDPSGFQRTSAMHVLSANGQVNYFGVCKDLTNVRIKPILIKKGRTKLALYGISHIRDERLSRLMATGCVHYEEPPAPAEDWFKILVLHQNREQRTGTKWIEDKWIPDFIDLVIWGHEHECKITPEKTLETSRHFYSIQPGSPVATSLCEAESKEKKIGVLRVHRKDFNMEEIKLKTVRPFIFHSESTRNWADTKLVPERFVKLAQKFINQRLLPKAEEMLTGDPNQPTLPLIRLRLEVEGNHKKFNEIRFGQQFFTGVVANPADMVLFREPFAKRASRKDNALIDAADLEDLLDTTEMKAEALAPQWFEQEANQNNQLQVLGVVGMCEAVTTFIEKYDHAALYAMVNHQIKKTCEYLSKQEDLTCEKSNISTLIARFRDMRSGATNEEQEEEARNYLDGPDRLDTTTVTFGVDKRAMNDLASEIKLQKANKRPAAEHALSDDDVAVLSDDGEWGAPVMEAPAPKRGRGRGRARGTASTSRSSSTTSRGRGRGRGDATSYRASGRSSTTPTSNGNRTMLNFLSRNDSQESNTTNADLFSNISVTGNAKKKAKITYASDSD